MVTKRINQNEKKRRIILGTVLGVLILLIFSGGILITLAQSSITASSSAATSSDIGNVYTPSNTENLAFRLTTEGLTKTNPQNMTDSSFVLPYGTETDSNSATIYFDFSETNSVAFITNNWELLKTKLTDGTITSIYLRPISYYDSYSNVAFNTLSCVANYQPETFETALLWLIDNRNKFSNDTTNDDYLNILFAGIPSLDTDNISNCIINSEFNNFVSTASAFAAYGPILGSSTVETLDSIPGVFYKDNQFTESATGDDFKTFITKIG